MSPENPNDDDIPNVVAKYTYNGYKKYDPQWITFTNLVANNGKTQFDTTIAIDNSHDANTGEQFYQGKGSIKITASDYAGNESTLEVVGGRNATYNGNDWKNDENTASKHTNSAFDKDTIPPVFSYSIALVDDINGDEKISTGDKIKITLIFDDSTQSFPFPPKVMLKETINNQNGIESELVLTYTNEAYAIWEGEKVVFADDNTTIDFIASAKDWASNICVYYFSTTVEVSHGTEPYMKFKGVPLKAGKEYTISSWVKGETGGKPKVVIIQVRTEGDDEIADGDIIMSAESGFIFDSITKTVHPIGNVSQCGMVPEKTPVGILPKWHRCYATFRFDKHKDNIDTRIEKRSFSDNDINGNGTLEDDEITSYMRNNKFDTNGNGKIDYQEFRNGKIGGKTYLMLYNGSSSNIQGFKAAPGSKAFFDAAMIERGSKPTKWTENISIHRGKMAGETDDGAIDNTIPLDQR